MIGNQIEIIDTMERKTDSAENHKRRVPLILSLQLNDILILSNQIARIFGSKIAALKTWVYFLISHEKNGTHDG